MASATTRTTKEITLTMNTEEAMALRWALHHVGGNPATTPRGNINDILAALNAAGVEFLEWETDGPYTAVYFKNPKEV